MSSADTSKKANLTDINPAGSPARRRGVFLPGMRFESDTVYVADRREYHIHRRDGRSAAEYYSHDDDAGFILAGLHDVIVDLGGATLVFHDRMIPFVISRCQRITLRNFTVTYTERPFAQFEIVGHGPDSFTVATDGRFSVTDGSLHLALAAGDRDLGADAVLIQPFDPVRRTPARDAALALVHFNNLPRSFTGTPLPVTEMPPEPSDDGRITFRAPLPLGWKTGQVLVFLTESREYVGILLAGSSDLCCENIRLKRVAGMGVTGFFCHNVTLRGIEAWTEPDSEDLLSINADGVHLLHCTGMALVENCRLEHMMDDGGNVHGQYLPVQRVQTGRAGSTITVEADLKWMNPGILGMYDLLPHGAVLTVYRGKTPDVRGTLTIAETTWNDCRTAALRLTEGSLVPEAGDHLLREDLFPEVVLRGCRTGHNRGVGFRISTPKQAIVEGCLFENSGEGIALTGDMNYWCEAAFVRDLTIRDNVFADCGHAGAGLAIHATPQYEPSPASPYAHSGIRILGNTFRSFAGTVVALQGCRDVVFEGNRLELSSAYEPLANGPPVRLEHCADCRIVDLHTTRNTYPGIKSCFGAAGRSRDSQAPCLPIRHLTTRKT